MNYEIWKIYAEIFEQLWGVPQRISYEVGSMGNYLASAEFIEQGNNHYSTSVILPMRNAYYSAANLESRLAFIDNYCSLREPILDYGCGVGFMLAALRRRGYKNLWGYDIESGPQAKILGMAAGRFGFNVGIPERPHTIFCLNVLEHMKNPREKLGELRSMLASEGKLYANCVLGEKEEHTAPIKEREEVIRSLRERGELFSQ